MAYQQSGTIVIEQNWLFLTFYEDDANHRNVYVSDCQQNKQIATDFASK